MPVLQPPLPEDVVTWCRHHLGVEDVPLEGPEVPRERLTDFARALKEQHHFWFFVYCAAAHFPAAGELPDRTLVAYRVRRLPHATLGRPTQTFPFRVWVPTGESSPSLAGIWAGADGQEREQSDLVGTVFSGHPDPRRLMMPDDWPGHPLRRDYAIETGHFPWR
ncbi:NADH-quinone oxidoreductase subunit C [Myxococcota bacterium]|nr:NADH-quinone oxidoreductase subunit C [Myxococcota bacterium]